MNSTKQEMFYIFGIIDHWENSDKLKKCGEVLWNKTETIIKYQKLFYSYQKLVNLISFDVFMFHLEFNY